MFAKNNEKRRDPHPNLSPKRGKTTHTFLENDFPIRFSDSCALPLRHGVLSEMFHGNLK